MRIEEYFKNEEVQCPCCGKLPLATAMEKLYALRIIYGAPIRVTSGARCSDYNQKVRGSKASKHIEGIAFDCKVPKEDEARFISLAYSFGFKGIGFKDNVFTHLDTRNTSAMWGY